MQLKNTQNRFGTIAMLLHWAMALIMIGMIILGLYMVTLPISLAKLKYYGWHKEWGVLILMLATVRLAWSFSNTVPSLPPQMPKWEQLAAHGMHYVFYGFMFALPITGWMLSSAAGLPVSFFGLFTLPDLIAASEPSRLLLTQIHKWLAYGLIAAICGHAGAALQHHFINKDDILRRMLP
ncbi:MAG TPA: cytochrome b [Candidatus Berkiella sp.]|nr:cytochrome b [Candidatus Berkiella sp.]